MSLNWQFTDKARFDALTPDEKKVNTCFVWGCMFVDLGSITEANAKEWHARYLFVDKISGPFYYETQTDDEKENKIQRPWSPTLDDVRKRIGLKTNVTTKTRSQFAKKVIDTFADQLKLDLSREEAVRS